MKKTTVIIFALLASFAIIEEANASVGLIGKKLIVGGLVGGALVAKKAIIAPVVATKVALVGGAIAAKKAAIVGAATVGATAIAAKKAAILQTLAAKKAAAAGVAAAAAAPLAGFASWALPHGNVYPQDQQFIQQQDNLQKPITVYVIPQKPEQEYATVPQYQPQQYQRPVDSYGAPIQQYGTPQVPSAAFTSPPVQEGSLISSLFGTAAQNMQKFRDGVSSFNPMPYLRKLAGQQSQQQQSNVESTYRFAPEVGFTQYNTIHYFPSKSWEQNVAPPTYEYQQHQTPEPQQPNGIYPPQQS